ncbi:MAG: divIC [Frankiales bacterium]|nr:divIC [Frankiales bacterium]
MPSKRRPGRQPGQGRDKRPVNAVRRTKGAEQPHARRGLTTRAAVLGLVVCALVVSAALPLREYLSQRGEIAAAQARLAAKQRHVAQLLEQQKLLQDPAYVKKLARERLHYVLPGETPYVVISPSSSPAPSDSTARTGVTAAGPEAPWYSQVWGSVRAADKPATVPAPKP